jgi:hypothetical protein
MDARLDEMAKLLEITPSQTPILTIRWEMIADSAKGTVMIPNDLTPLLTASFETLRQTNEHGAGYWSARDLQALLGYSQWRRFEDAIKRAMESCHRSGNPQEYHFAGAGKMIEVGKGALREVEDFHLSRFRLLSHRPEWRPP